MAFWRGLCKGLRESGSDGNMGAVGNGISARGETWSVPAPSPSYKLAEELEKSSKKQQLPARIPDDLKDSLQQWRQKLMHEHSEQQRKASLPRNGPEPEADPHELIVLEGGTGHKKPALGDTVRMGYVVTMEVDAAIVDTRLDFNYTVGEERGAGELTRHALEAALVHMRRGERSSMKCSLRNLFQPESKPVSEYGKEAVAVCEIKLCEIYQTRDCSFTKGTGRVVKEVVHDGIGAWCDNPTDEGTANVRIEEICSMNGNRLFPDGDNRSSEFEVVVGNGQVCDALECALLVMRRHETAIITSREGAFCVGGPPVGIEASLLRNGATFRVTLLDYGKGPDVWTLDEEERLAFAYRRKLEANRLFGEGRFHLACERYKRIIELFHHMNKKGFSDRFHGRFLGKQCRELCRCCRLNAAACCLRVHDPIAAKEFCDEVLRGDPENVKAFFRRAQAFEQCQDYVQTCIDLKRVLDIDPNLEEARRLFHKMKQHRKASEQKQCKDFKFKNTIDGLNDPRSIKNDYMDTPMDLPGIEGQPVSTLWAPKNSKP